MKADKQTSKHLLLAVVITVFSAILILTIIVMEWEPWVVPLMATGCVGVWSLHIGRGDQARMYENLCAGLMLLEFLFFGVHDVSLYDIPAVACIVVFIFSMLDRKRLLYVTAALYVLVLLYHYLILQTVFSYMPSQDVMRLALGAVVVFGAVGVARYRVDRRLAEQRQKERLVEQLAAAGRENVVLLSNVSHEFRTPINMVMGISEIILEKDIAPEIREDVLSIQMAGKRLSSHISNILDYTEIAEGSLTPAQEEYTITSVLVDVVLVLDALSLPAAAGLPTNIVSWEHFHLDFERQTLYRRIAARLAVRFSDYLVTLTPRDAENYREKLGRRKNIQWIYNPLPPELPAWGSGQREPLLVTAGRLEPVKGADLLARLAPSILLRHAGWRWLVLGEGSCRDALEEAARRYGLEDRLLLPGTVLDVANYLRRAALYVQASRTESFGMGLLEALACRTPCVCFDVPYGPAEMIRSGVNGFLIPPFDLEDMEEKISLLIENSSLRERLRENTATGLDKFQLGPILDKWDRLLKQL